MCLAFLCHYWIGQYTDHGVEKGMGSAKNLESAIEFGVTGGTAALNVSKNFTFCKHTNVMSKYSPQNTFSMSEGTCLFFLSFSSI